MAQVGPPSGSARRVHTYQVHSGGPKFLGPLRTVTCSLHVDEMQGKRILPHTSTERSLAYPPVLNRSETGSLNPRRVLRKSHVAQQHHGAEQEGCGVGHVLACDVRGRPVNLPRAQVGQARDEDQQPLPGGWNHPSSRTGNRTGRAAHPVPQARLLEVKPQKIKTSRAFQVQKYGLTILLDFWKSILTRKDK